MTRGFWGGLAVTSLFLTTVSGSFLFIKFKEEIISPAPSLSVTPPIPINAPPSTDAASEAEKPQLLDMQPEAPTEAPSDSSVVKRNILFRLNRPKAKKVHIVGDFNNWYRAPMKKKGNVWEISVAIAPGSYEYLYVVDDKRIKDPNNKQESAGKSLLKVKPLTE